MAEITLSQPSRMSTASRQFLIPATIAVASSGLVALCAHAALPLPFTPVPLSLAPLAVIFLGLVLAPRLAFASLCIYLAEGAAGLPVFSPTGLGGILQLFGPTGGYLLSYPFAAAMAGFLYGRKTMSFPRGLVSAGAASFLILVSGAAWLKLLTHMDVRLIIAQAVVPFLPGDVLKVCIAAAAAPLVQSIWNRRARPEALDQDQTH
jgi:biotin transport system substrate-specific component